MLGFSEQAFFQWRANPVSQRDQYNAPVTNRLSIFVGTIPRSGIGSAPPGSHRDRAGRVGAARGGG